MARTSAEQRKGTSLRSHSAWKKVGRSKTPRLLFSAADDKAARFTVSKEKNRIHRLRKHTINIKYTEIVQTTDTYALRQLHFYLFFKWSWKPYFRLPTPDTQDTLLRKKLFFPWKKWDRQYERKKKRHFFSWGSILFHKHHFTHEVDFSRKRHLQWKDYSAISCEKTILQFLSEGTKKKWVLLFMHTRFDRTHFSVTI